jgi:hypothetical protein
MAQGYYEKIYKQLKASQKVPVSKSARVAKNIANKKTVLKAGGVDPKKALDKRNPLEKLFNVTPDQNALFDIFEVINRPQQALYGAFDAGMKGEDVGQAALKGLSGDKRIAGSELVRDHLGVADSGKKWGWDDSLGLVSDIFLDPMDLALIPLTGGASVGAKAAGLSAKTIKKSKIAAKSAGGLDAAVDAFKVAAKNPAAEMISPTGLLFKGAGKGIKKATGLADTGIEKALMKLDSKYGVSNSQDELMKYAYKNPKAKRASAIGRETAERLKWNDATKSWDAIEHITGVKPKGRFETYKELKESFSKAFNAGASIPKRAMDAIRKGDAEMTRVVGELHGLRENLDDTYNVIAQKIAANNGGDVKKLISQLDDDLYKLIDDPVTRLPVTDILQEAQEGVLRYSDEVGAMLDDLMVDVNKGTTGVQLSYKVDPTSGVIKLSNDWDYVLTNTGLSKKKLTTLQKQAKEGAKSLGYDFDTATFNIDKLAGDLQLPKNLSPDELKAFEELKLKYTGPNADPVLKEAYEAAKPIFNQANAILDKHFGTGMVQRYGENVGYARHAVDNAVLSKYKGLKLKVDDGIFKSKGNTKVLAERKYKMSAEEANNLFYDKLRKNYDTLEPKAQEFIDKHDKLFKTTLTGSFDGYIEAIPRIAKDNKILDEILVKQTFGDFKALQKLKREINSATKNGLDTTELLKRKSEMEELVNMKVLTKADSEVPAGFKVLTAKEAENLSFKMKNISDQLGITDMEKVAKFFGSKKGTVAVNQDILRLIEVAQPKEVKAMVRMYDVFLNNFKKMKTLSLNFQLNNLAFNTTNMHLAGINPTRQAVLLPKAHRLYKNADNLMHKAARGLPMTADEKSMLKMWNGFIDAGFGDPMKALDFRDAPESIKGYFNGTRKFKNAKDFAVDGLPYLNNKLNIYSDTMARLAMFMEGSTNPMFLEKLGVADAGDAVRKALFDPNDLSEFERNVMKRFVPFYTFTKKNLVFQMDNLVNQGSKYNRLVKGYKSATDSITDGEYDNIGDFLKDNMYIPLPGLGKNGEYKMIRAQIPFGQLADTLKDPLGELVNMLTPALKAPIEMAINTNTFNGQPIEKFEGEKSKDFPMMTKKLEHLLGNATGLDVPMKQISRFLQGMDKDNNMLQNIGAGVSNMATLQQNTETDKLYRMYEDLDRLETVMEQYKQQGYEFSTLNELKRANKNTALDSVMSKLQKLQGMKKNPYAQK